MPPYVDASRMTCAYVDVHVMRSLYLLRTAHLEADSNRLSLAPLFLIVQHQQSAACRAHVSTSGIAIRVNNMHARGRQMYSTAKVAKKGVGAWQRIQLRQLRMQLVLHYRRWPDVGLPTRHATQLVWTCTIRGTRSTQSGTHFLKSHAPIEGTRQVRAPYGMHASNTRTPCQQLNM